MMHPLTCAGLSFVATGSLLLWDVFDDPKCAAAPACYPARDMTARVAALPPSNDLLCEDPRLAARRMPQVRVWTHGAGATCP